jgi:hypothetical protein
MKATNMEFVVVAVAADVGSSLKLTLTQCLENRWNSGRMYLSLDAS